MNVFEGSTRQTGVQAGCDIESQKSFPANAYWVAKDPIHAPIAKQRVIIVMGVRANISLDTDAYSFATAYARARALPLGTAVSELLRECERENLRPTGGSPRLKIKNGLLVKAKTGRAVTSEMVRKSSEDEIT